jgi:oligopeptide transport system ATP-binding protein
VSQQLAVVPKRLDGPLVSATDVVKHFPTGGGFRSAVVRAVDGVSLDIAPGETLGLVGESGCGKSTLGRVIMQLYPATSGSIKFEGRELTKMHGNQLRQVRQRMQIIFQDPYASLNPRMSVGDIIEEPLKNFNLGDRRAREKQVQEVMGVCGLNPDFTNRYPHEFSGGQRQRIGIARALVLTPSLIVADEPISALDVSIQAQIVNLLEDLQAKFNLTYLFIAHDLSVVRHVSDRVAVMYLGKIVEIATSRDVYDTPLHPYTKVLLSSIPNANAEIEARRKPILLKGEIPSPINPPSGCRFHTRCPIAQLPICAEVEPPLETKADGHVAACHFAGKL